MKIKVDRDWFERVMSLWDFDKLGCPLCGADSEIVKDFKEGFTTRYGCSKCNRWFNEPECID